MALNVVVFRLTYSYYRDAPQLFYLRQILGRGLCVSRGTANVINLNLGMLLLPVCHSLTTFLRRPKWKVSMWTFRHLIDHCKGFHVLCAWTVTLASGVHLFSHVFNAYNYSLNFNWRYPDVNAATRPNENPLLIVIFSVPGITGLLLLVVLSLMVSSAISTIRYSDYDLFWYNHRLFVVFYLLVLVHAFRGILREQTNLPTHTPGCPYTNRSTRRVDSEATPEQLQQTSYGSDGGRCDEEPRFDSLGCSSWMWISGPLLLYICDAAYRSVTRQSDDACVVGVTQHPGDVIEVQLRKRGFNCTPGQFVLVLCPTISSLEWHPYTVTRCPDSSSSGFFLHIKTVGDWSGKHSAPNNRVSDTRLPTRLVGRCLSARLYVDGPYGSPLEYVLRYRVSVCVAGGIGITPFIAHLHQLRHKKRPARLERIYLLWLCRDSASFLPFADLICDTHKQFWKGNHPDTFDVQLFLTSQQESSEEMSLSTQHGLLCKRVNFGRPNWDVTLSNVAASHPGTNIGIFCCGPKSLSDSVGDWSRRHSSSNRFHFYHESF
ncbi:hypothetical protein NP493_123g05054 [Ridgeia piscesae]|uniref:FAD-binding FR-type domain-containing protein n=1 Tax=Ridgeia piscesae TaxID=27915 RepID=A0AAD9P602_RIDPI|nr:hypothetical protein NP493_123g05054 [Ridgeia piscesae]